MKGRKKQHNNDDNNHNSECSMQKGLPYVEQPNEWNGNTKKKMPRTELHLRQSNGKHCNSGAKCDYELIGKISYARQCAKSAADFLRKKSTDGTMFSTAEQKNDALSIRIDRHLDSRRQNLFRQTELH